MTRYVLLPKRCCHEMMPAARRRHAMLIAAMLRHVMPALLPMPFRAMRHMLIYAPRYAAPPRARAPFYICLLLMFHAAC